MPTSPTDGSATTVPSLDVASAATRGERPYQEDAFVVQRWAREAGQAGADLAALAGVTLAILADGMGGHAGGEVASKLICQHGVKGFEEARPTLAARLIAALHGANRAIATKVASTPSLASMGSTMIGCSFSPSSVGTPASVQLEWVSVGDSPLYLVRRGEIERLNADHSMAPLIDQMAREGLLTAEEAKVDGRRHMLRSAVTGDDLELVDVSKSPLRLAAGDVVILASDGIETLAHAEIIEQVTRCLASGGAASAIANALILAVESRRHPFQDNATVIVARIP